MTETELPELFITYARVPAGLTTTARGPFPTGTVAVTVFTAFPPVIVSPQVELVPLQAPLQAAKAEEMEGLAVRVTSVPLTCGVLAQVPGQLIPPRSETTVPAPAPVGTRLTEYMGLKVAVTLVGPKRLKLHEAVPLHGPALHPTKLDPLAGVVVRLRPVPLAKAKVHEVAVQTLFPGSTVTVPPPGVRTVSG
jgi:hypothetical protein